MPPISRYSQLRAALIARFGNRGAELTEQQLAAFVEQHVLRPFESLVERQERLAAIAEQFVSGPLTPELRDLLVQEYRAILEAISSDYEATLLGLADQAVVSDSENT